LINIDFDHFDFAIVAGGDIVNQWANHFARAAPFRPKIYQNRRARFQYIRIEAGVGYMLNFITHKTLLKII
jgi:hypothetical protein